MKKHIGKAVLIYQANLEGFVFLFLALQIHKIVSLILPHDHLSFQIFYFIFEYVKWPHQNFSFARLALGIDLGNLIAQSL